MYPVYRHVYVSRFCTPLKCHDLHQPAFVHPATRSLGQQRCAGDFCETRAGGRRASDDPSGRENGMPSEGTHPPEAMGNDDISKYLDGGGSGKSNRGDEKGGGGGDGEGGGGGERGVGGGGEGGGGGGKVMGVQNHKKRGGGADDVVGRRKHALSVETPRTVLFRLVS